MRSEVVLVDDMLGKSSEGDLHVFKAWERCAEIEVFNVDAKVACAGRADYTVPQDFGGGEVGCPGSEFAWVVDEVAAGCKANAVGVLLLWAVVDHDACVHDDAVFWYLFDLLVREHKD